MAEVVCSNFLSLLPHIEECINKCEFLGELRGSWIMLNYTLNLVPRLDEKLLFMPRISTIIRAKIAFSIVVSFPDDFLPSVARREKCIW